MSTPRLGLLFCHKRRLLRCLVFPLLIIPFPSSKGTKTNKIQLLKKIDGKVVLPSPTPPFAKLLLDNGAIRKSSLIRGDLRNTYSFAFAGLHAVAERTKKKKKLDTLVIRLIRKTGSQQVINVNINDTTKSSQFFW